MKALLYRGVKDIHCTDIPDPSIIATSDAIIEVDCCAICGSDLHLYHGHGPGRGAGYCVGHEAMGRIVDVGSTVGNFRTGDRVLLQAAVGCGRCKPCLSGDPSRCDAGKWWCFGMGEDLPGAQAEFLRVPMADCNLRLVPEGISDHQAVLLTDNLPTAYTACRGADIAPGCRAAVVGLGPIGLHAVELAMALGAGIIFAIDPVKSRRRVAEAMGAIALHPDEAIERIREETRGNMVDSIVEAVGSDSAISLALAIAARRGTVSCLGASMSPKFPFPMANSFFRGLTFRTGIAAWTHLDEIVGLILSGRIKPERIISHSLQLVDGAEGYRLFDKREALKVVFAR